MSKAIRFAVLALGLLAALPAAAPAQLQQVNEPGQTPGWTLTPIFALSSAWDDNVGMVGIGEPESSDVLTLFSPSIEAGYLAKRHWLGVGYTGSFSVYRQLDELNSFDQHLRLDTRHLLSKRLTLSLHEGFAAVPTTDAVLLSGVPFLRTGSRINDAGATLRTAIDGRTTATVGYGFTWVAFDRDSPFAQLLKGGQAHSFSGNVVRQVSRRLSIGAEASFRRSIITDLDETIGILDTAGTVAFEGTRTLTLSAALGVSRVSDATRNTTKTGPAWRVSAVQRFERATLSASWARSFAPAFGLGGSIQNEEFSASLVMPVARNRFYWQGGLSYRKNEPLLPDEIDLRSLWLQTSVGYGLHRRVRIEAFYARSHQDSLRPGGRVNRDRVGIQLITSKPMRIK